MSPFIHIYLHHPRFGSPIYITALCRQSWRQRCEPSTSDTTAPDTWPWPSSARRQDTRVHSTAAWKDRRPLTSRHPNPHPCPQARPLAYTVQLPGRTAAHSHPGTPPSAAPPQPLATLQALAIEHFAGIRESPEFTRVEATAQAVTETVATVAPAGAPPPRPKDQPEGPGQVRNSGLSLAHAPPPGSLPLSHTPTRGARARPPGCALSCSHTFFHSQT